MDEILARAYQLAAADQPFALATVVRAEKPTLARVGAKAIVTADRELHGWVGGSCARPTVIREAARALEDGQPRLLRLCPPEALGKQPQAGVLEVALTCVSGGTLEIYIEPHLPQPDLVILGHLAVAEALARLGSALGYRVTVMGDEVSAERFPQAEVVRDHLSPGEFPHSRALAVVVASHGNYDEAALEAALHSPADYIALVTSKSRAAVVLDQLRTAGFGDEDLGRIKYPAGLDLGAETPDEIALSILAEIVQRRRRAARTEVSEADQPASEPLEAIDPVCGMTVEIAHARYVLTYQGRTYYFCAAGCRRSFEQDPEAYLVR